MPDSVASDVAGAGLVSGDLVTLRGRVVDSAGGIGVVVVQLLNPSDDTVVTGSMGLDRMTFRGDQLLKD